MAINLSKGQKISLAKETGDTLSQIRMGLGWDMAKPKGFFARLSASAPVDLDASCILFNASGQIVDSVWFKQLKSKDGTVAHSGDNRTGEGAGDDESITAELSKLPATVTALVFVVNSFTGQSFEQVASAYCRILDAKKNTEIARFDLSCQGPHTGQIMAKVYRHNSEWKMHAIGENATGRTFEDMLPQLRNVL